MDIVSGVTSENIWECVRRIEKAGPKRLYSVADGSFLRNVGLRNDTSMQIVGEMTSCLELVSHETWIVV